MGKKLFALLLAVLLTLGMLAGCGKQEGADNTSKATEATKKDDGKQEDKSTEEQKTEEAVQPVSLRLVLYGEEGARSGEFLKGEWHDKLKAETGIDLKIDYQPWGSTDQIATMLASGEKIAFMNGITAATYSTWGSNGWYATYTLDEVEKYAPALIAARENNGFEACKYAGEYTLIPAGSSNYTNMYDNFNIRNDILNQVGLDYKDIHTYEDLKNALAKVHEQFPDLKLIKDVGKFIRCFDEVYSDGNAAFDYASIPICAVNLMDNSDEVISFLESDYLKNICGIAKELHDLGYITTENLTDQSSYDAAWNSGDCLSTSVL